VLEGQLRIALHDGLGDLFEQSIGPSEHVRLRHAGDLAGVSPGLPLPREVGREACNALDARLAHDLHRERAGPVVAHSLAHTVGQLGKRAREVGEVALAAGIQSFGVLPHDHEVDAARIHQR
jgi:hypothetical protein